METITNKQIEWATQTRNAVRHLNQKRNQGGHLTHSIPWTYAQFRDWFKNHYENGVRLRIHTLQHGNWHQLLRVCRAGMTVPDWKTAYLLSH